MITSVYRWAVNALIASAGANDSEWESALADHLLFMKYGDRFPLARCLRASVRACGCAAH